MPDADRPPLVFVTVGTDHHPFDRLVQWMDRWIAPGGRGRARLFVQAGSSMPSRRAPSCGMLGQAELEHFLRQASVIVSHGGPSSIMEARRHGFVPIVVPRRRMLGEVVDDHQVAFCRRLHSRGEIRLAETEATLHGLLDRALEDPGSFRSSSIPPEPVAAVRRFDRYLADLFASLDGEEAKAEPPVRVLYIAGAGRSGTTLLQNLLGEVEGLWPAGELMFLWERGLLEDQLCGCGLSFHKCLFWRQVGKEAFEGLDRLDPAAILRLQKSVERHRYIPLMLEPRVWRAYGSRVERFARIQLRLYRAIRRVSGARVILDSSKSPSYGFLLRLVPGIDLRAVHLVRDSRGVAHSCGKQVRRPEITRRTEYMPRYQPGSAAGLWLLENGLFHLLQATGTPMLRVKYERLLADTGAELARVVGFAGEPAPGPLGFLVDGHALLHGNHTVAGNPMRFLTGAVSLQPDLDWETNMQPRARAVVTAVTWPLLKAYRYPVRPAP